MNIEPNTIISGRYAVLEKIGVGGMAVVYKAMDQKLNRYVTLKVLKEEHLENQEFINRFAVEAQAAARLSHPNIVNVYDVGNDGNVYYIVMEYIDGITLKELINKKAPFDNQEALSVAIQIASALEEAHKNNIVHRDIKPHNILVTRDGDIKVTDFGIARAATSTTVNVESMGSVHYFSPEQARGGFVDAKSDIYSLGIVLFEMVTGRLPFNGDTPVALAMKHLREPIPDVRRINPNVSESIYLIILKATQKSSSKRYQTVEDMNRDLKRATKNDTGDFVVFEEDDVTSQTIRVTGEELNEIKKQSQNQKSYKDYDDGYDEYENYDKRPTKNNARSKTSLNKYEAEDRKKDMKVIIAAVGTAVALMIIISLITWLAWPSGKKVIVPDFVGKTWEEALELAQNNNLYLAQDGDNAEEYSDDIPEGVILEQNVDAGKEVNEGDTILLKMSLGSDIIEVPNLVGKSIDDAESELKKLGLKWTEKREYNDEVEKEEIIRQDPEKGEEVKKGEKITIYISKGKESENATIPNVTGISKSEAQVALRNKGFEVEVEYRESSRSAGIVIEQSIEAGEKRETGTTVTIYVSSGMTSNEDEENNVEQDNSQNNANDSNNNENSDKVENNNEQSNNVNHSSNNESSSDKKNEKVDEGSPNAENGNSAGGTGSNSAGGTGSNSADSNSNSDNANKSAETPAVSPKVDEVEIDPGL